MRQQAVALQGTIILPCSGIVTDGIQAIIHAAATQYVNELVCMHEELGANAANT